MIGDEWVGPDYTQLPLLDHKDFDFGELPNDQTSSSWYAPPLILHSSKMFSAATRGHH
jgi:hypothetical protein